MTLVIAGFQLIIQRAEPAVVAENAEEELKWQRLERELQAVRQEALSRHMTTHLGHTL